MTKKRDLRAQVECLLAELADTRERLAECVETQEATYRRRSDAAKRGHAARKAREA